MKTISLTTD